MDKLKKEFIEQWGWNYGVPLLEVFSQQLEDVIKQEIDKEFNRRDCE